jgi:hydrogenase/urease accessory protein HupE
VIGSLEHVLRRLIFWFLPIARRTALGFYINLAFVAVMIIGLILSLRFQDALEPHA